MSCAIILSSSVSLDEFLAFNRSMRNVSLPKNSLKYFAHIADSRKKSEVGMFRNRLTLVKGRAAAKH